MTLKPNKKLVPYQRIPAWLIWIQCIAFVVLYAFWMLPEIVGFRNTALVVGAIAGLYPIYQFRFYLFHKSATPIWLLIALFVWVIFHLLFLSHDYDAQLLELKRIWKYAVIGAIFALGLGISLANASNKVCGTHGVQVTGGSKYWPLVYFGLCLPVLIYLFKYFLTKHDVILGIQIPPYLHIQFGIHPFYVPKTDYVAFCLPPLAVALGQIKILLAPSNELKKREYLAVSLYLFVIAATFFLFYIQDIKNGIAYATLCVALFLALFIYKSGIKKFWWKLFFALIGLVCLLTVLYPHVQKNESWRTLVADTKIALQTDKYEHWKYLGDRGFPDNEYGVAVNSGNYVRAAWFKVGLQLSAQNPLGYGLIEDSFKQMAKARWPDVSPKLSHSHSGWLDVILAVGYPGFACLFAALLLCLVEAKNVVQPWEAMVRWSLISNAFLWITTEVSATITFPVLIFWICWAAGLTLIQSRQVVH